MTAAIHEMTRVKPHQGIDGLVYWCVEVLSPVTAKWLVQGEYLTKAAAEQDRENWL